MTKRFLPVSAAVLLSTLQLAAAIDELSRSVIQMTDDIGVFEEVNGVRFQVFWKRPNTNQFIAKPWVVGGTGCLIGSRKGQPFILTAKHIATQISSNGTVIFFNQSNEAAKLRFGEFVGGNSWIHHPIADISVHPVNTAQQRSFPLNVFFMPFHLFTNSSAPSRDLELAILGFPFGLGIEGLFSPISRQSRAASGILTEGGVRYFLLQDPSIDGYSGGPVFTVRDPNFIPISINSKPLTPIPVANCWGVISATKGDSSGGKMAIVIPATYAVEMMDAFEGFRKPAN